MRFPGFFLIQVVLIALVFPGCNRADTPSKNYPQPTAPVNVNKDNSAVLKAPGPDGSARNGGIPEIIPVRERYALENLGPKARLYAIADFDGDGAVELFALFETGEPDPVAASGYYNGTYIAIPAYAFYRNKGGQWTLAFSSSTTTLVCYPVIWKDSGTRFEKNTEPMPYCLNLDGLPGDEILLGYTGNNYSGCLILKILPDRIVEAGSLNSLEYVVEKSGLIDRTYLVRYEGASQFTTNPEKGLFQKYSCYYLNSSNSLTYVTDLPVPVFDFVYKAKKKYFAFTGKLLDFHYLFWFCYANNPASLNDAWVKDQAALVRPVSEAEKWTLRKLSDVFRKRLVLADKEFTDYIKEVSFQWKFE
jgi:hypothetical protein